MKERKRIPIIDLPGEEWLPVVGFEGLYCVSNKERVKSLKRKSQNNYPTIGDKILKCGWHSYGYPKYTLCKEGKFHYLNLHRIVATAFIPNPLNLPCINHIDFNPKNNVPSNLEWCTFSHNSREAYRSGNLSKLGEKNHMSKLTRESVMYVVNSEKNKKQLSQELSVSEEAINDIRSGRRWGWLTGIKNDTVKPRIIDQTNYLKH